MGQTNWLGELKRKLLTKEYICRCEGKTQSFVSLSTRHWEEPH